MYVSELVMQPFFSDMRWCLLMEVGLYIFSQAYCKEDTLEDSHLSTHGPSQYHERLVLSFVFHTVNCCWL